VVKVTGASNRRAPLAALSPHVACLKRSRAKLAKRNITELTALVTTPG
jgi:hypothetical protein